MGFFDTIVKVAVERWDKRQTKDRREMELAADFLEAIADGLKEMVAALRKGEVPADRCEELRQNLRFLLLELGDSSVAWKLGDEPLDDVALELIRLLGHAQSFRYDALGLLEVDDPPLGVEFPSGVDYRLGRLPKLVLFARDYGATHDDMLLTEILSISGWCRSKAQQLRLLS